MAPLTIPKFKDYIPGILTLLEALVEHESPTTSKESVDRLGLFIADVLRSHGAVVTQYPQKDWGDHWLGEWGQGPGGTLLMVHIDTVHPLGTLQELPWSMEGDKIFGPGILDMKASIAIAINALAALSKAGKLPSSRISLLCTSDEEMGSPSSKEIILDQAREHDLVLCLEPALPDGSLKTWRKGTNDYQVTALGRSSHAGAAPELGVNAIHEMIAQLPSIIALADPEHGTTVNIGIIEGGTRPNVIPDTCTAKIDVRTKTVSESDRIASHLHSLEPILEGAILEVHGGDNRPPMERTPVMIETFQKAKRIASQIGLSLTEGGTGGGSDANFVSSLGMHVLDGLGLIGEGAHTKHEFIEARSLPERTALLAALLSEWDSSP